MLERENAVARPFCSWEPIARTILIPIAAYMNELTEGWHGTQLGRVRQGVFIERDGVLNEARTDESQYQASPLAMGDFRINTEAVPLLARLKAAGLVIIVTTNQPGLSGGYLARRELDRMHDALRAAFELDDILVCPHDAAHSCFCRRPLPGLLVEAGFKWRLDLNRSYVISDKWQDAEAARAVGCTSVLLASPWLGKVRRDLVAPNLKAAVEKILQLRAAQRLVPA
jgi:D-glycero-D-manno-heptose 1,7-bisphosphate phosphatase